MNAEDSPESGESDGTDEPQKVDPIARGVGIGCLGVVVVFAALILIGSLFGSDDQSGQVKIACREWVKDRLKSPGSADFSNESVERRSDVYVVTGSVDSDNSFGASIRNNYRCTATNSGGSSTLLELTGIEN